MQKIWPHDHDTPKCRQDHQVAVVNGVSGQSLSQSLAQGLTGTSTLFEPVIIGRTWHYHLFVPADDPRYMSCLWPGCDVEILACSHHYQNYGPAYQFCPGCQEVRRVETGGLFLMAQVQQPIGGDVEEGEEPQR